MLRREKQKLNATVVIQMSGNQFPFGQHVANLSYDQTRKILVRKQVYYRNAKERAVLESKLNVLKGICHRNVINIKSVQEVGSQGYTIYYNYVPLSLANAFQELDHQTFKELHKQVIQLAIHLAKNYILTPFNPNRCGVVFVEGKFIIKYYLPFNEIILTENISMLERSVQLFKVQAMHMLDTLCHNEILTDIDSLGSEEINLRRRSNHSRGKDSGLVVQDRNRKMSSQSFKKRKFSNYKSIDSELKRKKSQDETNFSQVKLSGLKKTLTSFKVKSERKKTLQRSKQKIKQRVQLVRIRSQKVLKVFQSARKQIDEYNSLARLLKLCRLI